MNIRRFDELDDILMDIPELGSEVQVTARKIDSGIISSGAERHLPTSRYKDEGNHENDEASVESDAYSVEFEVENEDSLENDRSDPPPSAPELLGISTSGDNQPSLSLKPATSSLDAIEGSNRYDNVKSDDNSSYGSSPASSIASDPSTAAMAVYPPANVMRLGSVSGLEVVKETPLVVSSKENNSIGTRSTLSPRGRDDAATSPSTTTTIATTTSVTAKRPNIYSRQLGANKALYSKVSFNNINSKPSREAAVIEASQASGGGSGRGGGMLDVRQVEEVVRRVLHDERQREQEKQEFFSEKAKKSKPISYLRMGVYDEQRRAGPTGLFGAPLDAFLPFFDPDYEAAAALNLDYPENVATDLPVRASGKKKSEHQTQSEAPKSAAESHPKASTPPVGPPQRPPVSAAEALTYVVGDALRSISDQSSPPSSPDSIAHPVLVSSQGGRASKRTVLKKSSMRAIDLREKAELVYAEFMKDLIGMNDTCLLFIYLSIHPT
jgi:hypothetical protein